MREEVAAAYGGHTVEEEPGDGHVIDETAVPSGEFVRPKFGVFFWICVGWMSFLVFIAAFANVLPFKNPDLIDFFSLPNQNPSWHHWLGTDQLNRDILSRLAYGARVSLVIGFFATAIGVTIGGTLGMASAYFRGRFDSVLGFFMYVGLAFPAIIAVLAILDFWGRSEVKIIIVLGAFSIPLLYRLIRSATLSCATKEYVTAARSQGATARRVLFKDIFPNVAPSLIAYTVFTFGGVIATEGAIAFLGLSVPDPTPTWGNMIAQSGAVTPVNLSYVLAPAIALFLTLISLNYIGERIRVHFDTAEGKL